MVNKVPQVIFPGGDCVIYSFDPNTGKLLWKCDCLPKRKNKGQRESDLYIVGSPVVVEDKLFVGLGVHPEHAQAPRWSWFLCLNISMSGDVSLKSYDAKSPANKNSALVWAFGGPILPAPAKGREVYFGRTISTAAVHDGLVYISEEAGYLHCLDMNTGNRHWQHDLKAGIWGSPYWADGKIYIGDQNGEVRVFAHGKTRKLLATNEMDDLIHTTPAAANGVLFVMTNSKLYAIGPP